MNNFILILLLFSQVCFGRSANQVYRMPSSGNVPGWGPVNLADGTNAITGVLASKGNLPAVNQQVSSSSGGFSTSNTSFIAVTNVNVSITTIGRPVFVSVVPDGSGSNSIFGASNGTSPQCNFKIRRDAVTVGLWAVGLSGPSADVAVKIPAGSVFVLDAPSAGTYTYELMVEATIGATSCQAAWLKMVAFEL